MEPQLTLRAARPDDADTLADYNVAMARETEAIDLHRATVGRGVRAALADAGKALYFVAESRGRVVAQLMITHEWSDWRDGDIWWVQSVYVHPDFRRAGAFKALYRFAEGRARAAGAVGLRLYVDRRNVAARGVYEKLGMRASNYQVMEVMFAEEG